MSGAPHVPVLLDEVLDLLQPGPGKRIVDGTFGFGGHTRAMLEAGADVLGVDLDRDAQDAGRTLAAETDRFRLASASFRHWDTAVRERGWEHADGLLLDLGVSSLQLDDPDKGFSYRSDAPLDLRFDQTVGESAAALVARLDERGLADLIWRYGEERGSRRIAGAIVRARAEEPVATTGALADVVRGSVGRGPHVNACLSRVFQALRIAVNDELGALEDALAAVPRALRPGGRLAVIGYHSLEDRIVKKWLARENKECLCPPRSPACTCGHRRTVRLLTRRAVVAGEDETERNPRARSARLRGAEVLG